MLSLVGSAAAQQPQLVADINHGKNPFDGEPFSNPRGFVRLGAYVYFEALDPYIGRELYRTVGIPGSTELVADIRPGVLSSTPMGLAAVQQTATLFFSADTPALGR